MAQFNALSGQAINRPSLYSSNGGASWTNITADYDTYGWSRPGQFATFTANGKGERMSMQSDILPSPFVATRALASAQTVFWRTSNGNTMVNASDGYDGLGGGNGQFCSLAWCPTDENRVAKSCIDKGLLVSRDGGFTWSAGNLASTNNIFQPWSCVNVSINPDKGKQDWIITGKTFYNPNPAGTLITKDFGATRGNSVYPSFFANNAQNTCEWYQAYDPADGKYAYSQSGFSSDYGLTWMRWSDREIGNTFASQGAATNAGTFHKGVIGHSHSDGAVLWAAGNSSLLRSPDRGRTWSVAVPNAGLYSDGKNGQIVGFIPDPTDARKCYWWKQNSGLRMYEHGVGVSNHYNNGIPSYERIQRIRVDYSDPSIIYALSRNNYEIMKSNPEIDGMCRIWRSVNGPAGPFVDITANHPRSVAVRAIEIDPFHGILHCVGTPGTRFFAPPYASARFKELVDYFGE